MFLSSQLWFRIGKWGLISLAVFENLTRQSFGLFALHFHSDSFRIWLNGHFWTFYPCNFSSCRPISKHGVPVKRCSCLPKWLKVHKDCHTCLASARNLCFLTPLSYQERYLTGFFAISAVSCLFQTDVTLKHYTVNLSLCYTDLCEDKCIKCQINILSFIQKGMKMSGGVQLSLPGLLCKLTCGLSWEKCFLQWYWCS